MSESQRPNVLLITSDQHHYSCLGSINPKLKTPHLDRLANEGTRFNRAYCNNPTCTPSRATIITGLYPSWHGAWSLGTKLDEDVPTVGERFHDAGYATQLIGKAHFQPLRSAPDQTSLECQPTLRDLDFWRDFTGPWYGFDHIELTRNHADESHVGQHYAIWMEEKGLTNWGDYYGQPKGGHDRAGGRCGSWDLPAEYHYTTWTGERTCANIEKAVADGKPFFTWASFHDPHPPYLVPEPWASMYDPADMEPGEMVPGELADMPPHFAMTQHRDADWSVYNETPFGNHGFKCHLHDREKLKEDMAIYYGMISFMDDQIGRILNKLDELGVADNTIVVFTTDHGHFLGQHGLIAKGGFQYEDGIKLPFLVRWPNRVPAGQTNDALQGLIDLPTTFLSAAGIDVPLMYQGVNQLDVWQGKTSKAKDFEICEFRHQPTAVHLRTLITQRYKMTVYRDKDYGELIDLQEDPGELKNLWDDPAAAEVKAEMLRQFVDAELKREPMRYPRIAGA